MRASTISSDAASASLVAVARAHGATRCADALVAVFAELSRELRAIERELVDLVQGPRLALEAARHLVAAGGKRVRPAVALLAAMAAQSAHVDPAHIDAAGLGALDPAAAEDPLVPVALARTIACAVEAVHTATLLHDDVIDLGGLRRGRPTARAIYGNAASVLGGDLLLVRALALLEREAPWLVPSALATIAHMVEAESLQLERRGRADLTIETYMAIVEGKTAALFAWAARAGAEVAPRGTEAAGRALGRYGRALGVAFQLADDLLDLTADEASLGKSLLQDVQEGKVTYALIPALQADAGLAAALEEAAGGALAPADVAALGARARAAAERGGGLVGARRAIGEHTRAAVVALDDLPDSRARRALVGLAEALAERGA